MNAAHWHLLINHLPLFSIIFGCLALLWSMVRSSRSSLVTQEWQRAAVLLFILSGISLWISSETGESAEDIVKHLPSVTKELVHEHEEAAEFAVVFGVILAFAALVMEVIQRYKPKFFKIIRFVVLVLGLLLSTVIARTAYLGGHIRHTEIRSAEMNTEPRASISQDHDVSHD